MSKKFAMAFFSCAMLMPSLKGNIFESITNHDIKSLASLTNRMAIVNSRNEKGETPLMAAARLGDVEIVKILISAGAEIEARDHGFSVKDQIDSYLRRTGEARAQIVSFLRKDGFSEKTIRAFEAESDKLQGTPDRIKAWKDILLILSQKTGKAKKPVEPLSFERALSVWVEKFEWTKDGGFSLSFRDKNRPTLRIGINEVRVDATAPIRLKLGMAYTLSDVHGRTQTYKVCALPFEESGIELPPTFMSEREVLTFEHKEPLLGGEEKRIEKYVVTGEGEIYDVASRMHYKRRMPMLAAKPLLLSDAQIRRRVLVDGVWALKAAQEEMKRAQKAAKGKRSQSISGIIGMTNNVCYSASESNSVKWGILKWAQVSWDGRVFHVNGITEHFSDKGRRQIRFYPSGAVKEWVEENKATGVKFICLYDESNGLKWQIKMRKNKVFEFWRVENGRIEESSDLELAQKLAEQATIEDVE